MALSTAVIQDLAVLLLSAFIVGAIFIKLKQQAILGYLLAGVLIGPFAMRIVSDTDIVSFFADLGVTLLMFSVGLAFSIKKLKNVGAVAIFAGIFKIILVMGIGNSAGILLGFSPIASLYLGGILSISSTTVIAKVLQDLGYLEKRSATITVGILIVEDLAAIVLLTLFGSIAVIGKIYIGQIFFTVLGMLLFFLITLIVGLRLFPKVVNWVKESVRSDEIMVLTAIGFCFILASLSWRSGYSAALGAFLAGMIIADSKYARDIEKLIEPVKNIFAVIFFVSIGMLLDVFALYGHLLAFLILTLVAIIGKIVISSLGTYLSGQSSTDSIYVGMGMVCTGEFSFVMAKQGMDMGVVDPLLYHITVGIAIVTMMLTPYLIRASPRVDTFVYRHAPNNLKNFFAYLASWTLLLGKQIQFDKKAMQLFKKGLFDIFSNLLIIAIVWFVISALGTYIAGFAPSRLGVRVFSLIITGVLILPSAFIILKRAKELIDASVQILSKKSVLFAMPIVRYAILNIFFVFAGLVIALIVLPPVIIELSRFGNIISMLLLFTVVACGYLFWRAASRFQFNIENTIKYVLIPDKSTKDVVEGFRKSKIMDQLVIATGSPFIGKTVKEAKSHLGVAILSIDRDGETINNPHPSEKLLENDILVIMGSSEERERAQNILIGGTEEDTDIDIV